MSFISQLLSGGTVQIINSVGNALDKVITTKEEHLQLEQELKKAEHDYQLELNRISLDEKKALYGDIDSARKRESEIQTSAHASSFSKNISPIMAISTIGLTFTLFYILVFSPKMLEQKEVNKDILIYILGVLSTILTQVYSYYFGSSQGSAAKNTMIEQLQKQRNK